MQSVFKHVMVTTDLSEASQAAVDLAIPLARSHGARLTICHVLEPLARPNPLYAFSAPVGAVDDETRQKLRERVRKQVLARVPEEVREQVEVALPIGTPFFEILQLAKRDEVDLIVIAPRGHTGVLERILGGTAYKVVREAPCPVLVVH